MDDSQEAVLLIATTMIALIAFAVAVLAVMIIYRKRKTQHQQEIQEMHERFSRELLQAQMEVQTQTMQHIGREIHDNVGQQLTLAFLYTQQVHPEDEKLSSQIQSVAKIINDSLGELRNLSRSLTDPQFMGDDLDQLVRKECFKLQSLGLCNVNLINEAGTIEASSAVKSFILRILQEFLQNSLKHSQCTAINLSLHDDQNFITLKVSDNGKGFAQNQTLKQGLGLSNMKKRASILHADLDIESVPGKGTKMTLLVPKKYLAQYA